MEGSPGDGPTDSGFSWGRPYRQRVLLGTALPMGSSPGDTPINGGFSWGRPYRRRVLLGTALWTDSTAI